VIQITQNGAKTGLSGKIPKKWQFTMRTDYLSAVLLASTFSAGSWQM